MRCVLSAAVAKLLTKKAADSTQKTAVRRAASQGLPAGRDGRGRLPRTRVDRDRRGAPEQHGVHRDRDDTEHDRQDREGGLRQPTQLEQPGLDRHEDRARQTGRQRHRQQRAVAPLRGNQDTTAANAGS